MSANHSLPLKKIFTDAMAVEIVLMIDTQLFKAISLPKALPPTVRQATAPEQINPAITESSKEKYAVS